MRDRAIAGVAPFPNGCSSWKRFSHHPENIMASRTLSLIDND
jgi:hypothetical protein